jgi:hypothetical protein
VSAELVVLERVTRFAPFGVWFWDAATQTPVRTGLDVVHRPGPAALAIRAVQNRSGVYVLSGLPGLGAVERGRGDDGSPPAAGRYRIEATDPDGRFLPTAFDADLPAPTRGLFDPGCGLGGSASWPAVPGPPPGSPPAPAVPRVPLFSAPSRPVPAGMAVLRAQLELGRSSPPGPDDRVAASWALLEVIFEGRPLGVGAADGNGLATVVFPWPEPPALQLSPPAPGTARLSEQTWTLGIGAYVGGGSSRAHTPIADPTGIPDLCALLDQTPATLLADDSGTPLSTVQLRYGRELVVRTSPLSSLLLVPSGSPPSP